MKRRLFSMERADLGDMRLPAMGAINGSEKLVDAPNVHVDARWRPLLERAGALKEALDHALRWKDAHSSDNWVGQVLAKNGISLDDARLLASDRAAKCTFPDHFAQLLLGSWFRAEGQSRLVGWVRIPEWSVLGWVRKDAYRDTVTESATKLRQHIAELERRMAEGDEAGYAHAVGPSTCAIEGIPLFWAAEGKNRTQLYRLAQVPRTTPLRLFPRPNVINQLRLRRVAGFRGLAALECPGGDVEVLPFAELSEALLGALGVQLPPLLRPSIPAALKVLRKLHSAYGVSGLLGGCRSLSAVRLAYVLEPLVRRQS